MIGLLVLLLWLFAFCLVQKPITVSTSELQLQYLKQDNIDVVLLEDTYEKLNAILKFIPWARKIHIQTHLNPNPISNNRIIFFKQNLLHYSLTAPFLSQHFIVIESGYTLTNYLFSSQFFIDGKPVIRLKNNVFGITRSIFNENAFYEQDKSHQVMFALKKAIKNHQILYKSHPLIHVQECVHYTSQMELKSDNNKPIQTVIIVSESYFEDINMNEVQQIWILLIKKVQFSYDRLHFFQRVLSANGIIIEIIPEKNLENVIVEVISKIKSNMLFKPKFVFGPKQIGISNMIANKISQVYDIGFTILEKEKNYLNNNAISNYNTIENMLEYNLRLKLLQK